MASMDAPSRRSLPLFAAIVALAAASPAHAATGGTSVPVAPPTAPMGQDGGTYAGPEVVPPAPVKKKGAVMPTLTSFVLARTPFADDGTGLPISFRMAGTTGAVRVKLGVYSAGRLAASFDLGRRRTRAAQRYPLSSRSARNLPAGSLVLRLSGSDARGHHLRASLQASAAHVVRVSAPPAPSGSGIHTFPLLGTTWFYPGSGGRFGAARPGHVHQGQDISAPSGTPIVAPGAGTVTVTSYQAAGAGYYVVMREAGQNYWYVFMHLLAGSTLVHAGQQVSRGQQLGKVGATGDAEGPHLHFEIWQGPWAAGGHPI